MKYCVILLALLFSISQIGFPRSVTNDITNDAGSDDPAYKIYKEGYDLVLDEQWQEAAIKFRQVLQQHPQSRYVQDAQFWNAYILAHSTQQPQKAVRAYSTFLAKYPASKYIDEVIADLAELKGNYAIMHNDRLPSHQRTVTVSITDSTDLENGEIVVIDSDGEKNIRDVAPPHLKEITHTIRIDARRIGEIATMVTKIENDTILGGKKNLKRSVRMLQGPERNNQSYHALKGVLLDSRLPRQQRVAAISSLSDMKKINVVPVLLDVIRLDTCPEIQVIALDHIRERIQDKEKTVSVLEDLFRSLPEEQTEQRQMVFYSIADIGNDRAIDFLATIARSNRDSELRGEAIYYLGSIGSEKARDVLAKIIQGR
jgi:hypothetical protein